ncbi:hypothetical protein H4R18_000107 [Coemansia javaensis]|uniref:Cyclin-like domain-containing protein n=1 Tax=Coemansia javaensis TaxID=2761396 RepID=A0A9W8HJ74_9FUNG|nr:hypothetical protein H4R18_000107 [Coemansia javaensis]
MGMLDCERLRGVVGEVLRRELDGVAYQGDRMGDVGRAVSAAINARLAGEPALEQHKLVTSVTILEASSGQGARMGCAAVWDPAADALLHESYVSDSIRCEAAVLALRVYPDAPLQKSVTTFSREDLKQTPSVACGWTVEREELDRAKACALICSASRKLQLPQITSASACVFLHRFFMRHTLKEYHHYNIAATCLFVACKAEESLRKLDSFIPVIVYYASKGNRRAPPGTGEYEKWRAVILGTEAVVLQALCFDVVVEHPHARLVALLDAVGATKQLSQMAWSFVGDCMRLPLCIVFPPRSVACASLALATRVAPPAALGALSDAWLDRVGANRDEVAEIVQWLLGFYAREAQARLGPAGADPAAQTPAESPASASSASPRHQHQHQPLVGAQQQQPPPPPPPPLDDGHQRQPLVNSQ